MSLNESLHDVAIRERQLEAHILRSSGYLKRANQEIKRHVYMLYLAIALLLVLQALFAYHAAGRLSLGEIVLISMTALLAILNCVLLIQTKTWLRRLNEAWLGPQEKIALEALKLQRHEILTREPRNHSPGDNAGLN